MDNEGLKKLIRKAEVDNTTNRIKAGEFKARPETKDKPKSGSRQMNLTKQQREMLANLSMGGRKNYRVATPEKMGKSPQVGQQVRQRLKNKLNTKTPGGDIDPETGDLIPESVKKAGHPEAFELGLDKDTTSNTEYQKILRRKRIERAAMMSDPTHPHHETDDVSQDDVEAADRAARRRKRIGEAMGKFDPRNVGKDAY